MDGEEVARITFYIIDNSKGEKMKENKITAVDDKRLKCTCKSGRQKL